MERLRKARTAARGWVTKTTKRAMELLDREEPPVTVSELSLVIAELDKRLSSLEEAQSNLELEIEEEEIEREIEAADDFRYEKVLVQRRCEERLQELTANAEARVELPATSVSGQSHESVRARLPKLELPKFSGDITQWQSFWDQFSSHIDETDLPVISKLTYLLSLLEGPAKDVVQGVPHTSDSYKVVTELLTQRYGKPERIIHAHVQALLSLHIPLSKGPKYTMQLWKLKDEVVKHIRSLEALGISGSQCAVLLTPMILTRLPTELCNEWSRVSEGHESDLEWLLKWLQKEIEIIERSEMYRTTQSDKVEDKKKGECRKVKEGVTTASALHATSISESVRCSFCGKNNHKSEKCFTLLALEGWQRLERMKRLGLCFRCLRRGHMSKDCRIKCRACKGDHNVLMCGVKVDFSPKETTDKQQEGSSTPVVPVKETVDSNSVAMLSSQMRQKTVLQTAKVRALTSEGRIFTAKLLFDNGCDRSYISNKFVKRSRPKWITSTEIPYSSFGGHGSGKSEQRNVYEVRLLDSNDKILSFPAANVPVICQPLVRPVVPKEVLDSFKHLDLADDFDHSLPVDLEILVGLDFYWSFMSPQMSYRVQNVVAMKSSFGWVLSGDLGGGSDYSLTYSSPQLLCISPVSDRDLCKFWDLESIGISSKETKEESSDILEEFQDNIRFVDDRYEVQLPWKNDAMKESLKNNVSHARTRLNRLLVKLKRDEDLKAEYKKIFDMYENTGIIEQVPEDEIVCTNPVYYMPHRPVISPTSISTKIRPVFDASAKGPSGVSLNDCMTTGPSLNPNLAELLVRFRRWPFAITADIAKAFLQISVHGADKDVHRFLLMDQDGSVRHMRFRRVPFGNTASPFLLNATIKYHLSKYPQRDIVQDLQTNMYVDNWLSGGDSINEVYNKFQVAHEIFKEANMSLEKLVSNNISIASKFSDKVYSGGGDEPSRVLGLKWCNRFDTFSFDGITLDANVEVMYTKRTVLSMLARIFDPLGLISPFVMFAKTLFQEIWMLGLEWDDELPSDLRSEFGKWVKATQELKNFNIERCYFQNVAWSSIEYVELHGYGDASLKGYGACVYIRICSTNGCQVSLVMSKSRVAPIKKPTLPRLELMGALLCARLVVFVKRALNINVNCKISCWTDSTITLGWIKGDPGRRDVFVKNRVSEIQQLTPPSSWHHCDGDDNPADLITRGILVQPLVNSPLWWNGPSSLSDTAFSTEEHINEGQVVESCQVIEYDKEISCLSVQNAPVLFNIEKYNDLQKSIRIVGYVLRFINNCKSRRLGKKVQKDALTYQELEIGKTKLIYVIQREAFPKEIIALSSKKPIPQSSKLAQLNPFLDEGGLLRVKGRLQFSDLSYDTKHPVIIPKCHFGKLLIKFQHRYLKHAGVNTVVSSLRTGYWVIGLRRLTKNVLKECMECRRHDSRPCSQVAAPLPDLRVKSAPPFSVTGLDFAGPLFSSDYPGKKLYVLLFTCAIVRAVHLELTDNMSLTECMLAIRRFIARRGLPTVIYSDNAKSFVAAASEIQRSMGHLAPQWRFIVPKSPWWGGFWERLVYSVKSSLKKSLGVKYICKKELETMLFEIESCINSRPLTYVGDEADFDHYVTPSHFLLGRNITSKPLINVESIDNFTVTSEDLQEREIVKNQRLDHFWNVWKKDYLSSLPPVVRGFHDKCNLSKGNVVLVSELNLPRLQWPLGVVVEVYPGKDGLVRSVDVKTSKGIVKRSIQKLHDLEICSVDPISSSPVDGCKLSEPRQETDEDTTTDYNDSVIVQSRRGRIIKKPEKLDL